MKSTSASHLGLFLTSLLASGQILAASYRVPVPPNSPESAYSQFPLEDLRIIREGRQLTVSYTLPPELMGASHAIELTGEIRSDRTRLRGPFGKADCNLEVKNCEIEYKHLSIDRTQVIEYLKSKNYGPEEFNARLSLADRFNGDPIGIIYFE